MNNVDYNYTVYNKNTGEYIKNLDMPDERNALLNIDSDTEILIEGANGDGTYWQGGLVRPCEPRTNPYMRWNGAAKKWFDPRDEQEILNSDLKSFSISKADFISKSVLEDIISVNEITDVVVGVIPAKFTFIDDLDRTEEVEFRVWWASATTIWRTEKNVLLMIDKLDVPIEVWNDIFGVN